MGKLDKGARKEFLELTFLEFLQLIKVLKMLYGRDVAEYYLTKGMSEMYNIDIASMTNKRKEENL